MPLKWCWLDGQYLRYQNVSHQQIPPALGSQIPWTQSSQPAAASTRAQDGLLCRTSEGDGPEVCIQRSHTIRGQSLPTALWLACGRRSFLSGSVGLCRCGWDRLVDMSEGLYGSGCMGTWFQVDLHHNMCMTPHRPDWQPCSCALGGRTNHTLWPKCCCVSLSVHDVNISVSCHWFRVATILQDWEIGWWGLLTHYGAS